MIVKYTVCFHPDNGSGDYREEEMNLHGAISIGHEILTDGLGGPEYKVFAIVHDIGKSYIHVK